MTSAACEIGVWGLGTMGAALAQNFADRELRVALWNRTPATSARLAAGRADGRLRATDTPTAFVAALTRPRRILLMVPAGAATSASLDTLLPLLERGDVLVDGGNAHFKETEARQRRASAAGVALIGCGVSGGEDGARHGPALMAGGERAAWDRVAPALAAIAARSEHGTCAGLVGPGGAGHFVKMVHNGIEYADLAAIAETWDLLRRPLGLAPPRCAEIFAGWNGGPLQGFLVELAARLRAARDPEGGGPLVLRVADAAGQKGTGRWAACAALELGVAVPCLSAAVDSRVISSDPAARARLAALAPPAAAAPLPEREHEGWIDVAHDALLASRLVAFAQGFALMRAASSAFDWQLDLAQVARLWTAGCILRARVLPDIMAAYARQPALDTLLADRAIARQLDLALGGLRRAVALGAQRGLSLPVLGAALAYVQASRDVDAPLSLTQGQRDAFGAHGVVRRDDPERRPRHYDW